MTAPARLLRSDDPLAVAVTDAIRSGDLGRLQRLLVANAGLATARIVDRGRCGEQSRSLLHVATDWPGHFPKACHGGQRRAAEYLLGRGADPDWVGHDQLTAIDAARRSGAHEVAEWLRERGARSAAELT